MAVAIDMVFPEQDRMSPSVIAEAVPQIDRETRTRLAALPENDEIFAEAIRRSRVVVGQAGARRDVADPNASGPTTSFAVLGEDPTKFLLRFPTLLRNVAPVEAAAAGRGVFSVRPENDGVIRRLPALTSAGGVLAPSLALELLRVATGEKTILVKTTPTGVESVVVGGVEIPTDRSGQLWVHFAAYQPEVYVSAASVLRGAVAPERLAGKLVFIGTSAIGLLDLRATPLDNALPGVEAHAQLLETILTGAQLVRPDYAIGVEIVLALAAGLVILAFAPRLGASAIAALGGFTALALATLCWRLFVDQRVLIDVAYPLLSTFTVLSATAFYKYLMEEQERGFIRNAFSRYLAPDMVDQLAENREGLTLGGQTRTLTLLFTDLRGFTSLSEKYKADPQGLTTLLNRFLTPLSDAIIERRGTIDKYMGDAIMAFWNAPLEVRDHPIAACEAALDMRLRLAALNQRLEAEARAAGRPFQPLEIGIGVNTGDCVVGNMGSDRRFDYSALGDAVNLASRIEGLTKQFDIPILVGDATAALCGDQVALIAADRIRVKGKSAPETIHMLLGARERAREKAFLALRQTVDAMRDAYRAARWDEAAILIEKAREFDAEGRLAGFLQVYEQRIHRYRAAPPPPDWDGVFTALSK